MTFLLALCAVARATTLEEAWAASAHADLQVQLAQETSIQQDALRGKAWSALVPRVSAHASEIINDQEVVLDFADSLPPDLAPLVGSSEPIVVQKKAYLQGDVTATARLFGAGAVPGLRAAYALSDAGRQDLATARASSKAQVASAYYAVLTAQRGVEVAGSGVALAKAQQELAEQQRDAGSGGERAVLQARLGVSAAARDLASAREGALQAETAFELLTGLPADGLELPEPFAVPSDVDAAIADARENRPDLLALDARARAARLSRTGTDLGWLPALDVVGSYNYSGNTGLTVPDPWSWRVVFQASWDLWDGGLRLANERDAASRARAAELGRALAADGAERDVKLAFEAHTRAEAALAAVESDEALAEESLRLAEDGYAAGNTTWIEVESARLQLQATELSILRERMTRDLAAIDLLQTTGRL